MDFIFIIVPLIVMCGFVFVFGSIIGQSVRQWKREKKNDASPRLTVPATVIAKRDNHAYYPSGRTHGGTHRTRYFVTFQFDSGDRLELELQGNEYGLLIEGDKGNLTFQGTRYLDFQRT